MNVAVTFDLWQTLIFEFDRSAKSNARRRSRTSYTVKELARLGENVDSEFVHQHFLRITDEITVGHDHGLDALYEEWISKLMNRIVPGIVQRVGTTEISAIGRVLDRTFIETPPRLVDGSIHVLDEIAARGVRIGLISNTGLTSPVMYREWFGLNGLLERFDHLTFSNELSMAKPNPQIYELTLDALGIAAGRALHVGDNIHTDVGGAAAVGMSTVWVRGGIESPVSTDVKPDFVVDSVVELPEIVDEWVGSLDS